MKKISFIIALAMTACTSQNPFLTEWDTPFGIPPFEQIKNEHYLPAFKAGVAQQEQEIADIIADTAAPSFENVIEPMECSGKILSKMAGVLFNLSETMDCPEIEAVIEELLPLYSEHSDNIYMNPELFAKVKTVYDAPQDRLSREQQMVLKKYYESFINNGIGLDAEKQARLREINSRLSTLEQKFGSNLLAENNAYAETCGSTVSEYYETMAVTEDRDQRKKMFEAYANRCNRGNDNDNNALVLEILSLKQEKAKMLGYNTPAEWILHDKMAKTPEAVNSFLDGIMKAAVAKAKVEIADMQEFFKKDIADGKIADDKFQAWDYMYYMEKVKKAKYDFDEEQTKPYFQMEKVRDGVFNAASRLYGIHFKKIDNTPKYHPEMEAFEVINDVDGSLIGVLLTDYFPRASKRGGAWMNNFRDQCVYGGENIRPIIVNVGNFSKPVDGKPGLMTIDNVETMFHEFGHALHGLLSQCSYPSISGTSVARDFVELPSQINENFAFQDELLKEYARHYQTDEVMPQELVDKILATRTFGQGFRTTELCAASILDMKWHELESIPADADAAWIKEQEDRFCKEMGLIDEIIPRYRTSYFNHIFNNGYSAGYYSYLWAEVLDKDAFQAFVEEGIFNRETGMRFRNCILSRGGSEEPMTLYREFRGADPNPEYLLKARGLK